jgi:hypothetical protein
MRSALQLSISVLTALIAGLLALISFAQPAADRLNLPYTVLLAVIGVALAVLASFLLYTPLINAFDFIAEPLVKFPFNATVFLVVFLPLLIGEELNEFSVAVEFERPVRINGEIHPGIRWELVSKPPGSASRASRSCASGSSPRHRVLIVEYAKRQDCSS